VRCLALLSPPPGRKKAGTVNRPLSNSRYETTTTVVVGDGVYKTRTEAETALKKVCTD
jgi:hypothetical protein